MVERGQGLGGCGPVGGVEVVGGLAGGFGLLLVVEGAVPVLGGDDCQEKGVEEGCEEDAVLRGGFTQDRFHRSAGGLGLLVLGTDAGPGCAFEGGGGLDEVWPEAGGGDQGECVEGFGEDGDVGLSGLVLVVGEVVWRLVDGEGEPSPSRGFGPFRRSCLGGREAFGDLGVGEVGGEGGAGEPHRLALGVGVAVEGDLVAADVPGREVLDVDKGAGPLDEPEELLGGRGCRDGGADDGAQVLACGPGVPCAACLLLLGAGGALGGGAVAARHLAQLVFLLDGDELVVGVQEVVPVAGRVEVASDLVATMWMWSSAWQTATQRQASGSPAGAMPVASRTRRAMVAHSSSVRWRSSGAARIEQCQTWLFGALWPACLTRRSRAVASWARVPAGSRPGSGAKPSQEATRWGSVCSLARPGPQR
ncbi:hypothetical protein ACFVH0_32920 [Streptomyces sp. NPDC127117]|uniref:hypothetical protein n=1 Tax=Streptomyces sp. NPDC127117 TaxID=3345368 RepID=UPI00363AFDE7